MRPAEQQTAVAARLGSRGVSGAPLGARTTYRVGGCAGLLFEVRHEGDLQLASQAVADTGIDTLVLGRGSNLLVADAGFPGLVLVLGEGFSAIDIGDDGTIRAGGAAALAVLARRSAGAGWRGLEWAVGVPGSVGGGVRMNAGGHGSDMAERLRRVRRFDLRTGEEATPDVDELEFGYRRSSLASDQVVVWAEFSVTAGDAGAAMDEVSEIVRWRRQHQPGGQNAGSVFVNPPGDSAGRLIDVAGCKGLRLGSAQVSTKHANFIVSSPGGSADEVLALIGEVRHRVREATGVDLVPEVRLIGFPPTSDQRA